MTEVKNDFPYPHMTFKSFLRAYFFRPDFRVLLNHRIGKYFSKKKSPLLRQIANYYKYKLISNRGCAISYKAEIGKKLRLAHPIGVIIGLDVIIKDNVTVFQHVTLGSHGRIGEDKGFPVIDNNVKIYAGAKILGKVKIGENSIIGANAVVLSDVPSNSIAVGVPAKIIKRIVSCQP